MSLACLDNIVTIRGCSDTQPLSGLDLMDAPEISKINLANIATEKDTSGTALAERILSNATIQVRNDLITVLAQNQMLVDVTNRVYETTSFKPTVTKSAEAVERGITLYKAGKSYDSLKTLTIGKIKIWALNAYNNVPVYIHDAGDIQPITSTYEFDLVEGLNEFTVDYKILGKYAHITMDATNVAVASAYLNLCAGCSGRQPNDCGYTQSYYDGRSLNGREGYGIGVDFRCECDYDQLMCNLAKTTLGKIIWMKARVMLMQERLASNRLNNWVVYGEKDIREYHLPKLEAEYDETWIGFTKSLKQVVNQYSGSCIVCNGIRSVVSV